MTYFVQVGLVLREEDEKRLYDEAKKADVDLSWIDGRFERVVFTVKGYGTWVELMCYEFNRWGEDDAEISFVLNFIRSCQYYQYGHEGEEYGDCDLETRLPEGMKKILSLQYEPHLIEQSWEFSREEKEAA